MKTNKLKLSALNIKSFTTNLKSEEKQTVNGGVQEQNNPFYTLLECTLPPMCHGTIPYFPQTGINLTY